MTTTPAIEDEPMPNAHRNTKSKKDLPASDKRKGGKEGIKELRRHREKQLLESSQKRRQLMGERSERE